MAAVMAASVVVGSSALAASREALRVEAASLSGIAVVETLDAEIVLSADKLTRYYFSKPGNPAYPYAVRLDVKLTSAPTGGGCVDIDLPMTSSAEDADEGRYAAVEAWMAAIEDEVFAEYRDAPPEPKPTRSPTLVMAERAR